MAVQQSDIDALDTAMRTGIKRVQFADGRLVENYDLDQLRRLRADMVAQLASASSITSRRTRTIIGRVGCW